MPVAHGADTRSCRADRAQRGGDHASVAAPHLRDEGTSILLVEQNAAFAVKTADYVHVMSQGRIVHSSEPAALWANQDIKTQLLGVPRARAGAGPVVSQSD